jgi:hypothetical protein
MFQICILKNSIDFIALKIILFLLVATGENFNVVIDGLADFKNSSNYQYQG